MTEVFGSKDQQEKEIPENAKVILSKIGINAFADLTIEQIAELSTEDRSVILELIER